MLPFEPSFFKFEVEVRSRALKTSVPTGRTPEPHPHLLTFIQHRAHRPSRLRITTMSARAPTRIPRTIYRKCIVPRPSARPFSTTLPTARGRRSDHIGTQEFCKNVRGTPMHAQRQEQLGNEKTLQQDIGIIPGSFIRAPMSKLISSYPLTKITSWKTIILYHWRFLQATVKAAVANVRLWWQIRPPTMHVLPWKQKEAKNLALAKYTHLYQSFARGDSKAISDMCLDAVAARFQERIAARPRGRVMQWKVSNPSVRIVSNRSQLVSETGSDTLGFQQIVFRIKSAQSLLRPGEQKTVQNKGVIEYMVLQRVLSRGQFNDWTVWGFTNEWMPQNVEENAAYESHLQRYQAQQVS
ncbi:unnamed protein product [Periconia digitata]|uniref:Tim44-like domain-containing protein n=1 Tax=Periconia digitata TaxID=1303443 RepID=A0A9W4XLB8_9PLEO|nr:unnamed protein product [Periconia digitata]